MAREDFPSKAESYLNDIEVIEIVGDEWRERVAFLLNSGVQPRFRSAALERVFDIVADELKCRSVVIEPYQSTDFADEYSAFYSRLFQDVPKLCRRLHFFAGVGSQCATIGKIDVLNLGDDIRHAYRGYCVVRPTCPMRVGDTVLTSPFHHGGLDLVHCHANFETHLLGHTLTVRGMPFLEQDSEVSVCADSDLWMLARYMHMIGECRRYRPSEMRKLATRSLFHGAVREGLVYEQMMDALRNMDLSPEFRFGINPSEILALLYSCVESEIPVIVGIPQHVVTVIGHGYAPTISFPVATDAPATMANFVTSFIAHNDAAGPYEDMPVGRTAATADAPEMLTLAGQPVNWCIFPEPPRVNLRRSDVLSLLNWWLGNISKLKSWTQASSSRWWSDDAVKGLVTREYLRRSDKFKRDIYPPADDPRWNDARFSPRPLEVILRYWRQRMPRYVWVIELARQAEVDGVSPKDRRIAGELVFDATAHHDDVFGALLAFHLDDHMLIRNAPGCEPPFESVDISLHNSYSPLLRGTIDL